MRIARRGSLVHNTLISAAGQVGKVLVQAVYFVMLARALGPADYGAFAALTALAALAAPFSSLGAALLLIRNVARDPECAPRQWSTLLILTVGAGTVISGVILCLSPLIAPRGVDLPIIASILLADIVAARLVENAGVVAQAQDDLARLAIYPVALNILRALAIGGLLLVQHDQVTLGAWALAYLGASASVALFATVEVSRSNGIGKPDFRRYAREWKDGLYFAVGLSAQSAYNDIDKTMLARINSPALAGQYSAAFRVVDMAYSPVRAVAAAAYPHFFRYGEAGFEGVRPFLRKIAAAVLSYSGVAGVAPFFFACFGSLSLGAGYAESVQVIRALAVLPLIRSCAYLAGDALSGLNRFALRSATQIAAAVLNIGMNLVLLPRLEVMGAVISTLVTDIFLAVVLWILLLRTRGQHAAVRVAP